MAHDRIKERTWSSYLALVPLFPNRTKSNMERRLVKFVDQSRFCQSNPLLRTFVLQNIKVCCVVVETSGAKSLQLLCMSLPYMMKILSKTNPRAKAVLDEINKEAVSPYLDQLNEVEWEKLASSLSETASTFHHAAQSCSASSDVNSSAACFGELTISKMSKFVMNGIIVTVTLIHQNIWPLVQRVCEENYYVMKFIVKISPTVFVVATKSAILLTLCAYKFSLASLQVLRFTAGILREIVSDAEISGVFGCLILSRGTQICLKKVISFCSLMLQSLGPIAVEYGVRFSKSCVEFLKTALPPFCKSVKNLASLLIPLFYDKNGNNVERYRELLLQLNAILQINKKEILPLCEKVGKLISEASLLVLNNYDWAIPLYLRILKQSIVLLAKIIVLLFRSSVLTFSIFKSIAHAMYVICPFSNIVCLNAKLFNDVLRDLKPHFISALKTISSDVCEGLYEIAPALWAAECEVSSTLFGATIEASSKAYAAAIIVSPALWKALLIVSPPFCEAGLELWDTFYQAATTVCPILYSGLTSIQPDVTKALTVVLNDTRDASCEVQKTVLDVYNELVPALNTIADNIPTLRMAFNEVVFTALNASHHVFLSTLQAQNKVSTDILSGFSTVNYSLTQAHDELQTVQYDIHKAMDLVSGTASNISNNIPSTHFVDLKLATALSCLSYTTHVYRSMLNLCFISMDALVFKNNSKISGATKICFKYFVALQVGCLVQAKQMSKYALQGSKTAMRRSSALLFTKAFAMRYINEFTNSPMVNLIHKEACAQMERCQQLIPYFERANAHMSCLIQSLHLQVLLDRCQSEIISFICYIMAVSYKHVRETTILSWMAVCEFSPKFWCHFKQVTSALWQLVCEVSPQLWAFAEENAATLWQLIVKVAPVLWTFYKNLCSSLWKVTCDISPAIWDAIMLVAPHVWSVYCDVVRTLWKMNCTTCSTTWETLCLVSSRSWRFSCTVAPQLWLAFCYNAKFLWEELYVSTDFCWDVLTTKSSSSWQLMCQGIASSYSLATSTFSVLNKCYNLAYEMPCKVDGAIGSLDKSSIENLMIEFQLHLQFLDHYSFENVSDEKTTLTSVVLSLILYIGNAKNCLHYQGFKRALRRVVFMPGIRILPNGMKTVLQQKIGTACSSLYSISKNRLFHDARNVYAYSLENMKVLPFFS